jgi:foldase protein PrsA
LQIIHLPPPVSPGTPKQNPLRKINPKLAATVVVILLLAGLGFYLKNQLIAASVDGHLISRWAVIKKLEKQNGKTALDGLVENQLIVNAAKKNNITVSDDEINKKMDTIKSQIESQGGTFDAALSDAGLTMADLRTQITLQVELEKLLGNKLGVSDDEVNKYIADNKVPLPAGQEETVKTQIREQLKSEKFNTEASTYISNLRSAAKIKKYIQY